MSKQLYLVPLPEAQSSTGQNAVSTRVQQSGLLQQGGTATEKIAAENIDLVLNGQWRFGETFSKKVANELESLGESDYSGLPFFDASTATGENRGYYELQRVDVTELPTSPDVYEYSVGLTFTGTKQTHWRAVKTNSETIQTNLATGSSGLIGIPATARKVRWFNTADGKESATVQSMVSAEFGDVDLYDPTEPTFDNPTLIYEVDFTDESPVDVRAFDDHGLSEYYTLSDGTEVKQWTHAFHSSFEYTGNPVVENGRIRLVFDETNGVIEGYEWNDSTQSWDSVTLDHGNLTLLDADIQRLGPAQTEVFVEFDNTNTGEQSSAFIDVQRGIDGVIIRENENYGAIGSSTIGRMIIGTAKIGSGTITDLFEPIASNQTTDWQPAQTLIARNEVI